MSNETIVLRESRRTRWTIRARIVVYEDLVNRRDAVLRGVIDFLGVPPATRPLRSTLVRPASGRTFDLVENRDDVWAALAGTDYESLAA